MALSSNEAASVASSSSLPKNTAIFIQDACLQHRYIRSKDLSAIVERPERLRAINIGLAAAIARLEPEAQRSSSKDTKAPFDPELKGGESDANDLIDAINKLKIEQSPPPPSLPRSPPPVTIVQSQATVDLMNHPATKFIHGDIEKDVYLENLSRWVRESYDKIAGGDSEIPDGLSQGDLYLCPGSLNAMQGAVATVCESVDQVMLAGGISRAFVAVRPPGHHCGEDTPSGFCFLNNVAIGAAHAHLQHGVKRVVIFDIDLHHGNGTQSIVWQINEESYRQILEREAGEGDSKPGPQIYYGSMHDILSYPCEDGKPNLVQAASVSIHKSHGQYIENVHLQTYTSEEHFWDVLYKNDYSRLIGKAKDFLDDTGGPGDDVLVFISCGMDACEHEYDSMSRHNRKVPASFYHRFARDAAAFSERYAMGRVISVLEGGYSDRALISGAMAHLLGLVDVPHSQVDEGWWSVENLSKLEAATKKRRGGRGSLPGAVEPWLERTLAILAPLESAASLTTSRSAVPVPPISMTLRDRSKTKGSTPSGSPSSSRTKPVSVSASASGSSMKTKDKRKQTAQALGEVEMPLRLNKSGGSSGSSSNEDDVSLLVPAPKKLPKVTLRLGKPPEASS